MKEIEAMVVPPLGLEGYFIRKPCDRDRDWHNYGSGLTHVKAAELCFAQFGDPPSAVVKTRWTDSQVEFTHRVTVKNVFEVVPERCD